MSGGEVADWIIARAQARGITISRRQLVKWHQAKLIPKPMRQFRGRPKAGSVSVYPAGTLEQAVACERWLRRDRNIARVGWRLWTEGFVVGDDLWQRPFIEAQQMFQIVADALEAEDIASSDLLQSIREALQSHNGIMRMIRRQIRGPDREVVVARILASVVESFIHTANDPDGAEQTKLFDRLFGMARKIGGSFLPEDVAVNLSQMTEGISRIALLSPRTIDQLEAAQCRDELNRMLTWMVENESALGKAMRVLRRMLHTLRAASPAEQAALILVWMSVREIPGWRDGLLALAVIDGQKRDSPG